MTSVTYWIEKYELPRPTEVRQRANAERLQTGDTRGMRLCRWHGEAEFVMDARGSWRCRLCRQEAVSKRRRKVKRILVDEAGGACRLCGYDRCIGALQFHHRNPEEKLFNVAQKGSTIAIDIVRREAAKCALLCANCHAEVEAGLVELPAEDSAA